MSIHWPSFTYNALRIAAGFMFFWHGYQKLFGAFGRDAVELASQRGVGGVLEFLGGLLIMIGFQTRWTAFICSGMMAVAYWQFHALGGNNMAENGVAGLLPLVNRGELAALYCFVFLLLWAHGSGTFSADAKLGKARAG